MIIEFFKYDLYRKYQTSDGVTYTPLDEYQCVLTSSEFNDTCEVTSSYATYGKFPIAGEPNEQFYSLYYYVSQADIDYAYNFETKNVTTERLVKRPGFGFEKYGLHLSSSSTSLNMVFSQTYIYSFESNWNTSNITTISNMFYNCKSLFKADLSSFDTSKVTSCNAMFYGCLDLTSLDLSNFDLSNVTEEGSMKNMFYQCASLNHIKCNQKLYEWFMKYAEVINLPDTMLNGTIGELGSDANWEIIDYVAPVINYTIYSTNTTTEENQEVILANKKEYFNAIKVNNEEHIINGVGKYSYTFPTIQTNNVEYSTLSDLTSINSMFSGCTDLSTIDLTNFSTSAITDMENLFRDCSGLNDIKLENVDTSNVTTIKNMFYNCSSLSSLDLSKFNLNKITDMSYLLANCSSLVNLNIDGLTTPSVTNMSYAFSNCSGLTSIDLTSFNISFDKSIKTNISHLFDNCSNITSINLSNWKITENTNISYLFANCTNLVSIDISSFDTTGNVYNTNIEKMFYNCKALKSIRCTGQFYFWCFDVQHTINMTSTMGRGDVGRVGSGAVWEIVDYDDYFTD